MTNIQESQVQCQIFLLLIQGSFESAQSPTQSQKLSIVKNKLRSPWFDFYVDIIFLVPHLPTHTPQTSQY